MPATLALITACNQGMRDNPAIGEAYNPIPGGHGSSVEAAEKILAAGVDLDFARRAIYAAASVFRPAGRNRQITTLRYLEARVIDEWAAHRASQIAATEARPAPLPPKSNGANGSHPPPRADLQAEAMAALNAIKGLIRESSTPGNGARQFIPIADVRKLGPRVEKAYHLVGGAGRILNTRPEKFDFLIRDFRTALESVPHDLTASIP